MTLRRSMLAALAAVILTLVATGAAATAGGPFQHGKRESGNQLVGTWKATVIRPAPLPPLQTLQVFTSRGVTIVVDNDPPATHTTQYGVWERMQGRLYAASGVFYRFNAAGAFIGSQKIDRTIELGPDGNTYKQVARVTVLDANGDVVTTFTARASAERMQVDRTGDLP